MKKFGSRMTIFFIVTSMLLTFSACSGINGNDDGNGNVSNAGDESSNSNANATDNNQDVSFAEKDSEDYSGLVEMWGWDDAVEKGISAYNETYPNIEIKYTNVAFGDYITKIQNSLAAGMDMPDIIWYETYLRGKLIKMGLSENLEADPYNLDRSILLDYSVSLTTNANDEIVCINWGTGFGGYTYRTDLFEEYFGVSEVEEVECMLSSWDDFIEVGSKLQDMSDGKVYLLPSLDDAAWVLFRQLGNPVKNGRVVINDEFRAAYETIAKMRDANCCDIMDQWSTAWSASIAEDGTLMQVMPTWRVHGFETADPEGATIGKWRMMSAPGGNYVWGGTAMGIYKDSDAKENAWSFIKWYLLTIDGAKANKETCQYYLDLKEAFEDEAYKSDTTEYFNNQDYGIKYFDDIAINMPEIILSEYDSEVNEIESLVVKAMRADDSIDGAQAVDMFITEMKNRYPEIEVSEE